MAFIKLDKAILTSTTWSDRDVRDVFITALLLAMPEELRKPHAQIAARSLDETGWVLPPGWYGHTHASGPGICRLAQVEGDAGDRALDVLGSPDPESRNQRCDGRRLVRIDGGFVVINYMSFLEKDHGAAGRMRRYRQRQAALRNLEAVTRNSDGMRSEIRDERKDPDPERTKVRRGNGGGTDSGKYRTFVPEPSLPESERVSPKEIQKLARAVGRKLKK